MIRLASEYFITRLRVKGVSFKTDSGEYKFGDVVSGYNLDQWKEAQFCITPEERDSNGGLCATPAHAIDALVDSIHEYTKGMECFLGNIDVRLTPKRKSFDRLVYVPAVLITADNVNVPYMCYSFQILYGIK